MAKSKVHCIGMSHHHAPVEIREKLKFTVEDLKNLVTARGNGSGRYAAIEEMVLVSTCNRVELYACVDAEPGDSRQLLFELLVEACREARVRAGFDIERPCATSVKMIDNSVFHYSGVDAVRYLCRVACGLDSAVLGETQILTQINTAFEESREARVAGPVLAAVFRSAHRAGKLARTNTAISSNPSSVSSVAVSLAQQEAGDLADLDPLVIGLGEMGQLALRILTERGAKRIHIANRSVEKARALAEHVSHHTGIEFVTYSLEQLPEALGVVDIVVSATGAMDWVVTKEMVESIAAKRNGRPLTMVDIAVPRDIDPGAGKIDGVRLFDGDDIKNVRDEAVAARQREIPKVEAIVENELSRLPVTLRKLTMKPLISELRRKAEMIRQQELERTYRKLGEPDPATWEHVQLMSRALINKLFHEPTMRIEAAADEGVADAYAEALRDLFGLEEKNAANE